MLQYLMGKTMRKHEKTTVSYFLYSYRFNGLTYISPGKTWFPMDLPSISPGKANGFPGLDVQSLGRGNSSSQRPPLW